MSKRKANQGNGKGVGKGDAGDEEDGYSTSSSYAPSAIDVSFNYVAPTEIDFMALKRLIQQLYHTHAVDIDLSSLAEHILRSGDVEKLGDRAVGTVVKVEDDEDGDPFAFVSALQISSKGDTAGQALHQYYIRACGADTAARNTEAKSIKAILEDDSKTVLQIFHERMINLPPQIMPPLYRMLFEELRTHGELDSTSYLLFFSRVFSMDALSDGDEEEVSRSTMNRSKPSKSKKSKRRAPLQNQAITKISSASVGAADEANDMGLFHPEDAILAKHALHTFTFAFPAVKDSDDSFNAPMYGRVALLKNDGALIDAILKEIAEAFVLPA
jgi:protein BCP1